VLAKDGGGERDWLNLLNARRPLVVRKKYPIQQGETRSTIPKYALYSPAMHCLKIQKSQFPHGRWRG